MGVSVANESIEAVLRSFCLGFDLQRIVGGLAKVAEGQNGIAIGRRERRHVRSAVGIAADDTGAAVGGTERIEVIPSHQDVIATRAGIADGYDDIPGIWRSRLTLNC